MKKEWFFFPLGIIFRKMGGIPVHRDKRTSMVDQLVQRIEKVTHSIWLLHRKEHVRLIPTGKRDSITLPWGQKIPIVLIGIDYEKKCITAGKYLLPTGDIEKDMKEIKLYFKDFKGKHPEKFTIGNID